ncbi:hypothetical protein [Brevundimonas lutea]|uniref:hypothetical protein n=1 Tax=Brevundimonas lutea TaxID=2293980 RepID=UPI000F03339E|nr:hypothetical protein [Brevundimonas lutea]
MARAELIEIAEDAADAYAAGEPYDEAGLAGRRFQVVVPFGCPGSPSAATSTASEDAATGLASWRWADNNRSLRLTANAADWSDTPELAAVTQTENDETLESTAGFWIPRPWQTREACPALRLERPPAAPGGGEALERPETEEAGETTDEPAPSSIAVAPLAPPPSPQTLGLVQLYTDQSTRTGRTVGRPHVHTIRSESDAPLAVPNQGYRLVLEGRIARFPNGRAVSCSAASPDVRPRCLVAVTFDRLAFRDPASETALAEWR